MRLISKKSVVRLALYWNHFKFYTHPNIQLDILVATVVCTTNDLRLDRTVRNDVPRLILSYILEINLILIF